MKKVNICILLLAWGVNMHADPVAEGLLLDNQKLKQAQAEKLREMAKLQDETKQLKLERENQEMTILQMESVLANIKDSAVPAINPPAAKIKTATTLLAMKFLDASEFNGRRLNPEWAVVTPAPDGVNALKIEVNNLEKQKNTCVGILLPLEKIAGKKLICSVMVKGENISPGKGAADSSKFMLMISQANKTAWPQASIGAGTFGWGEVKFSQEIPSDARQCVLLLGLQGVTGTIYFRDLNVGIMQE